MRERLVASGSVTLTATSGYCGAGAWFERGDRLSMAPGGDLGYVWRATSDTITLARGWRAWYLRLCYVPVRRVLRRFFPPKPPVARYLPRVRVHSPYDSLEDC